MNFVVSLCFLWLLLILLSSCPCILPLQRVWDESGNHPIRYCHICNSLPGKFSAVTIDLSERVFSNRSCRCCSMKRHAFHTFSSALDASSTAPTRLGRKRRPLDTVTNATISVDTIYGLRLAQSNGKNMFCTCTIEITGTALARE